MDPEMGMGPGLGRRQLPMGPGFSRGMGRGPRHEEMRDRVRVIIESPERMAELRMRQPRLADKIEKTSRLRFQIDSLLEQYQASTDTTEQSRLENRLRPLLTEEFELEMERQRLEVKYLEARLEQLKNALQRREAMKDRLQERYIQGRLQTPPHPRELPPDAPRPLQKTEIQPE
jgi:hypothetical protein